MSGHGISPAWVQNSEFKFGDPWIFSPEALNIFFVNCDIDLIGDVFALNTLDVVCSVIFDGIEVGHNIDVSCAIDITGDVFGTNQLNTFCAVVITSP